MLLKVQEQLLTQSLEKEGQGAFTLPEMIFVIAGLGILISLAVPSFIPFIEKAEVAIARHYLIGAVREYQMKLIQGDQNPTYTLPPQKLGPHLISTRRFQFPDSGSDGECLSPSSGNILTAAKTIEGQAMADYAFNINVVTGEKTLYSDSSGSVKFDLPSWLIWEGFYSPLIPNDELEFYLP